VSFHWGFLVLSALEIQAGLLEAQRFGLVVAAAQGNEVVAKLAQKPPLFLGVRAILAQPSRGHHVAR
jgi:hypothetical protein